MHLYQDSKTCKVSIMKINEFKLKRTLLFDSSYPCDTTKKIHEFKGEK